MGRLLPSTPWYREKIAVENRKRRQLERRWRKSGSEVDKQQYDNRCSPAYKFLKSTKMSHNASLINDNKSY